MTPEDRAFLDAFESTTLPFDQWTHHAHVKVAYLYARAHPLDEAIGHMRDGVRRYNAANAVPEGPLMGYDETTTHAFVHIVAAIVAAYDGTVPTASADEFCDTHPQLMSKHVLRLFYTPERRILPEAKTQFVEPDLAPLPRIAGGESE